MNASAVTLHPIGPTAFDALMDKLIDAERRGARMETRLVRLMAANGLNEQGDPLRKQIRMTRVTSPSGY